MAETYTQPDNNGHETRDISLRFVVLMATGLALLLAGSLALMAWFFDILDITPAGHGMRGASVAAGQPQPPPPRLQTAPRLDMQALLHTENERLQSHAWIDRSAGIARMPLEWALERVLAQGLPSWHDSSTPSNSEPRTTPEKSQ